ncbi:hypothetical protein GJAV_G00065250 [Gymnothorax javanicus]|nr:hypothetical protein GJAV_G00065250 [Gymnothorax javanicus]
MSKSVYVSKAVAVATVTIAALALATVIGMVIFHLLQTKECPHLLSTTVITPQPTFTVVQAAPQRDMRLPGNLIPESYRISLQVHLYPKAAGFKNQSLDFTGNSTVKFRCVNSTNTIYIHSKGLNVSLIGVTDEKGKEMTTDQVHLMEDERDFIIIQLVNTLRVDGLYYLSTAFKGKSDDTDGLFVNPYTEEENEERYFAVTMMESIWASKVFPCFDEPAMKAVFNVTIIHRKGFQALSNMPQKEQVEMAIDDEEWLITEFYPTKKMSTYLLCFIVFDFESIETDYGSYILKTWARPEVIDAGYVDYAHNITGNILDFFEEYTGLKYPLQKLDQVGFQMFLPSGMESWGLTMYSENILNYKEGLFPTERKASTSIVIAHELAHQWFGNLVTMKWWNDLWLKEGFSTYMSYLAMERVEPGGDMKDLISTREIKQVLTCDAFQTSLVLTTKEEDIHSKRDIFRLYNPVTYSKGAAVLRMLAEFLPMGVFQRGVQTYLKTYQYDSADTQDLWRHIQRAMDNANLNISVAEVMNTWTQQPGYPLIMINTTSGEVSQEHICLETEGKQNLTWQVPIKILKSVSGDTESDLLTEEGPVSKPVYKCNENEWILAGVNHPGFYRVNYNSENWDKLLQQLETDHRKIPTLSRAQLIDDAFFLTDRKYVNITLALSTTKYLLKDTEYFPWETARINLEPLMFMFERTEVYGPIQAYVKKLVGPLYDHFESFTKVSSVPPGLTAQLNQINAVKLACAIGYPKCQKMASDLFDQWRKAPTENPIHPNLRPPVYCSAIASGGELEWDFAWEMLNTTLGHEEKYWLADALACTKQVWLLDRYLVRSLDPDLMPLISFNYVISSVARNAAGQSLAWDFLRSKWSELVEMHGVSSLFAAIDNVSRRFSTEFELQQLKEIGAREGADFASWLVWKDTLERTKKNINMMEEDKHILFQWFQMEVSRGNNMKLSN